MEPFLTGIVAGFGIAIPVGAIALLIVQAGIRRGFPSAAAAGAGAATADLVFSVVAVVAGTALAEPIAAVSRPLRWVGAGVLAVIAVSGLASARRPMGPVTEALPRSGELAGTFVRFLGLTIVNPATVVYFAAFVVGSGLAADLTRAEGARFASGAFLASLSWQLLLAGVGAVARRRLSERFRVIAVVVGNLIVLGLAVAMVLR